MQTKREFHGYQKENMEGIDIELFHKTDYFKTSIILNSLPFKLWRSSQFLQLHKIDKIE